MEMIVWEVPINTVSEANMSEHWSKSGKRHLGQQLIIRELFKHEKRPIPFPCEVQMTRIATRELDDDNLRSSFKWIRDEISECLIPSKRKTFIDKKGRIKTLKGRHDSDKRIKWDYAQEKAKLKGVRITISPLTDAQLEADAHVDSEPPRPDPL